MAETKTPEKSTNGSRGQETRRMILAAATKVFAMHPYNAASIRMIAARGDFYHGLIRYHFPNKAAIFEAVAEDACRKLYSENKKWLLEIASLSPEAGLSVFLDRITKFYQDQPEVFRLIIQNLSHDNPADLPGYNHLSALFADTQKDLETIVLKGMLPSSDVRRIHTSMNILIMHYMGSGAFSTEMLGLPPKSDEYLKWVKDTIFLVFLPVFKAMRAENM